MVSSRSTLEIVFWILLCHLVHDRGVRADSAFLAYGVSVWGVSWLLSYEIAPAVTGTAGGAGVMSLDSLMLIVSLGVVAILAVVCGGALISSGRAAGASAGTASGSPVAGDLPGRHILDERLANHEIAVMELYAQGLTIGRVAQNLGLTKSTAQSYVKSAYRKLGIHSKDELIEYLKTGRCDGRPGPRAHG